MKMKGALYQDFYPTHLCHFQTSPHPSIPLLWNIVSCSAGQHTCREAKCEMRPQNANTGLPASNDIFTIYFSVKSGRLYVKIIWPWKGRMLLRRLASYRPLKNEKYFCFIETNIERIRSFFFFCLILASFLLIYFPLHKLHYDSHAAVTVISLGK